MKVIVLGSGTSQGVPVIACNCQVCQSLDFRDQRLRVSVYLEIEGKHLVIDTGPDFRQQMLREHIQQVDAVIYTHQHKDHTAGMDDLRSFNFKQQADIPIYARKQVLDQLRQEFGYIFLPPEQKYPGVLSVEPYVIENQPFQIKGVEILPIDVLHYKLPVFGFRIKNFTYLTDLNFINEKELLKVQGTRFLIVDALQKQKHISHFNLEEALAFVEKLSPKPEKTFFTHISHNMGFHAEVEKELPKNVFLAYDGLKLEWNENE